MSQKSNGDFELDATAPLFELLRTGNYEWWRNLKKDEDIYIDIRKGNKINIYYNGGSLMRLSVPAGKHRIKAEIHLEYIPVQRKENKSDYLEFDFKGNEWPSLPVCKPIEIDNFKPSKVRQAFKKKIEDHHNNTSEKGLQSKYVTSSCHEFKPGQSAGFFIDTEFQHGHDLRIDLGWLDVKKSKVYFVELKTIDDARLRSDYTPQSKNISGQLKTYRSFIKKHQAQLKRYYEKLIGIKQSLGLLPNGFHGGEITVMEKPILLIGDCTRAWLRSGCREEVIQASEQDAMGCVFHGRNTFNFRLPKLDEKKQLYYRF